MKPAAIFVLVVSTAVAAFLAGRMSVVGTCAHSAAVVAMPSAPPMPPMPAMPTMPSAAAPSGRVAELLQVPNYTYLRLTTSSGDVWAAVATTKTAKIGDTVTLGNAMPMHDFTSPTLKRTFSTIYFAELQP